MIMEKASFKDYKYVQILECDVENVEMTPSFVKNGREEKQVSSFLLYFHEEGVWRGFKFVI